MAYLSAIVKLLGGWRASAFALVAVLALSFAGVQSLRLTHAQGRIASAELERSQAAAYAAEQATKASEEARKAEQARAEAVAFADKTYQKGLQDGKAAADRLFADRDAGRLVLRDKFRCPAASGATSVAGSAGVGDGETGAVLSRTDQDFLVRLANEADDVARQLAAAQAVIEADRAEVKP